VPLVCEDGSRKFAWMPLAKEGALAPSADDLRLASESTAPAARRAGTRNGTPREEELVPSRPSPAVKPAVSKPVREGRTTRMTTPAVNGGAKGRSPRADKVPAQRDSAGGSLMEEAQALKEALRDAYGRASRLVIALQRQRKHSKLLATTLTSLRQLQHLDS
jgi:hypothetical protein